MPGVCLSVSLFVCLLATLSNKKLCFRTDYSASVRYLPKCKLKGVYSQPCNSNTAAPSVESGENNFCTFRVTESLSESTV